VHRGDRRTGQADAGRGVLLKRGAHAFTDGNALGGVGIVILESEPIGVWIDHEVATNVFVFPAGRVNQPTAEPTDAPTNDQPRNGSGILAA
jgi:hypothetical protein